MAHGPFSVQESRSDRDASVQIGKRPAGAVLPPCRGGYIRDCLPDSASRRGSGVWHGRSSVAESVVRRRRGVNAFAPECRGGTCLARACPEFR
jgi:hypothetical protein